MLAHSEAMDPEDGASHHLRGKALLGLGRIDEARAAFDRACTLKPQLLEAMLLRGACDRAMTTAREATGVAKPITDQLAELRDVLVDGRVVDAIQMLRRPAYDDDHTAQLLLAELLCSDDRHDDAFAIYDRLATPEAHLGRARALIALDRPAEALAALDHTALDEALDVRARALLALGRGDEAEALRDEYIRRIKQRSDRRLAHF
jgi:tetratricopeptide (TPR) repeat protein